MRIIGGRWKGRRLKQLKGRDVRPTTDRVRESWMSAMGGRFDGLSAVDLFAGSGALGLEMLSRGAEGVVLVESARSASMVAKANAALLEAGPACVVVADDVFRFLARSERVFDLALADPPYASADAARLIEVFSTRPFARALWLEHPSRTGLEFPPGARTRRYGDTAITTLTWDP